MNGGFIVSGMFVAAARGTVRPRLTLRGVGMLGEMPAFAGARFGINVSRDPDPPGSVASPTVGQPWTALYSGVRRLL